MMMMMMLPQPTRPLLRRMLHLERASPLRSTLLETLPVRLSHQQPRQAFTLPLPFSSILPAKPLQIPLASP